MTNPMPQNNPAKEETEKKATSEIGEISQEKKNPKLLKTFKEQLRRNKVVTA